MEQITEIKSEGSPKRIANLVLKIKFILSDIREKENNPFNKYKDLEDDDLLISEIMLCLTRRKKDNDGFFEKEDRPVKKIIAKTKRGYLLLLGFEKPISRKRCLKWWLHFRNTIHQKIFCQIKLDCSNGKKFEVYIGEERILLKKSLLLQLRRLFPQLEIATRNSNKNPIIISESPSIIKSTDPTPQEEMLDQNLKRHVDDVLNGLQNPENTALRTYFFNRVHSFRFSASEIVVPKESSIQLTQIQKDKLTTLRFDLNATNQYNWNFHKNIIKGSVVALDCEFATFENNKKKAISLAILNMKNEVVLNSVFRPSGFIKHADTGFHGITLGQILAAEPVWYLKRYVSNLLNGSVVVGYALKNDLDALKEAGFEFEVCKAIDIQPYYQFCRHHDGSPVRLSQLVREIWNLELPPHNALADAKATLYLYKLFQDAIDQDKECILEKDVSTGNYKTKKFRKNDDWLEVDF